MKKRLIVTLIVVFLLLITTGVTASSKFSDVEGHWASSPIQRLVDEGITNGYPNGTFKPNNTLTVAEFVAFLTKAKKLNVEPVEGAWYQGAIQTAINEGIIKEGEYVSNFYTGPMNRGKMARMIVRALGESPSEGKTPFLDDSSIPDDLKGYVKKAVEMKIIGGSSDGKFYPTNLATRAEAAAMLVRLIDPSERTAKVTIPVKKPQQKTNFIEPDINIYYNDNPFDYYYFGGKIDNIGSYNSDYRFKVEFENKLLNQYENEGYGFGVQPRNQWWSPADMGPNGKLFGIYMINNTAVKDKNKFKMYDGMEINFTIHVKNTKTGVEKKYPGSGTIHKIDFYDYGSPF